MRNLNGRELGGRNLRVDLADKGDRGDDGRSGGDARPSSSAPHERQNLPIEPAPYVNEDQKLNEVLWSVKNLIAHNPTQARQMLVNNPLLAASLVHALNKLEKIDSAAVEKLLPSAPVHQLLTPVATNPDNINMPGLLTARSLWRDANLVSGQLCTSYTLPGPLLPSASCGSRRSVCKRLNGTDWDGRNVPPSGSSSFGDEWKLSSPGYGTWNVSSS
jgi:hypothetical protein